MTHPRQFTVIELHPDNDMSPDDAACDIADTLSDAGLTANVIYGLAEPARAALEAAAGPISDWDVGDLT